MSAGIRGGSRTHLGLWDHSEAQLGVDQRGGGLRKVALVGQEAASSEAARTAQLGVRGRGGERVNKNVL